MRKRIIAVLLFCFLLMQLLLPSASADTVPYFTFGLNEQSAASGDFVRLKINANQTADTAAGFRIKVNYDSAALSFVRTETSAQIKSGTMATNSSSNPVCSVYVCNVDSKSAPELSGNIITYVFKVKDGVSNGKTSIGAHIDQVCNFQAKQLNLNYDENLSLEIKQPSQLSGEAYLNTLEPLRGKIRPEFSSDVYEYTMSVDYDVTSVEFAASAGSGGAVKINRKSLGKAGTNTEITATVTSADKQNKAQYTVNVSRDIAPVKSAAGFVDSIDGSSGKKTKSQEQAATAEQEETQKQAKSKKQAASKSVRQSGIAEDSAEKSSMAQNAPLNSEAGSTQGAQPQPTQAQSTNLNRNIYIIGSQMPTYVVGMLTAALCIMIGIAMSFWLKINPKKQAASATDHKGSNP